MCFFSGPDHYGKETLYFVIFQGGPDPLSAPPPPGSAHGHTADVHDDQDIRCYPVYSTHDNVIRICTIMGRSIKVVCLMFAHVITVLCSLFCYIK